MEIDNDTKKMFEKLERDLKGKNATQALPIVVAFKKEFEKNNKMTDEDKKTLAKYIKSSFSDNQLQKYNDVVDKMKKR